MTARSASKHRISGASGAPHRARPQWQARCAVIVRCRYLLNVAAARGAGAAQVVSEEAEAARAILQCVRQVVDGAS